MVKFKNDLQPLGYSPRAPKLNSFLLLPEFFSHRQRNFMLFPMRTQQVFTAITQSKGFHTLLSGKSSDSLRSQLQSPSLVQCCDLGCVTPPVPGCFHLACLIVTLLEFPEYAQFIKTTDS